MTQDFAKAVKSAIIAGFDGAEFDRSNGLFSDQFLQGMTNQRI
jgi:2,4-dienoyl-CoA reductase-like NADH-dependent reductase (Old Yellow Enzyme family)